MKKYKQTEAQLLEEADKLSQVQRPVLSAFSSSIAQYIHTYICIYTHTCEQELHEKTLLLHSSENERAGREAGLRSEAAGASQMAATLKAELERRSDTIP